MSSIAELPDSFFADAAAALPASAGSKWRPTSAMMWYDGIIDDILANPGTSIKETAARLNRAAGTLYIIVNSDLFKARYAQRRKEHSDALQQKLTAKLTGVASLALDSVKEKLEKQRDQVPLPQLVEIVTGTIDRLGYAPQRGGGPSVVVNTNAQAVAAAPSASPDALAKARMHLRTLELQRASESGARGREGPLVLDASGGGEA